MMILVTMYPRRRRIHVAAYDYSQPGYYFVTLCAAYGRPIFGIIEDGAMRLTAFGALVRQALEGLEAHYLGVSVDSSIVMPNHVHAIVVLTEGNTPSLHEIVRRFKSFTVGEYRRRIDPAYRVEKGHRWQDRYHDIVLRNDRQLDALRRHMENNPAQWELDAENRERRQPRK